MEATLVPLALFACIAYCVVGVTRLVTEARTRRRLVQAGASLDLLSAAVGAPPARDPYLAVRWALVLGAVGAALVVVQFVPYGDDSPLAMGIVSVAAALGLFASYAVGRRLARRDGRVPPPSGLLDAARALPAPAIAPTAVAPRAPAPVASAESA